MASPVGYDSSGIIPRQFVGGLGGADITPQVIQEMLSYTYSHDFPEPGTVWIGVPK